MRRDFNSLALWSIFGRSNTGYIDGWWVPSDGSIVIFMFPKVNMNMTNDVVCPIPDEFDGPLSITIQQ